ncbi:MAG: tRNA glutamyl-Q(34) synthetase GluQRS [Pseudomonadota bacterium]
MSTVDPPPQAPERGRATRFAPSPSGYLHLGHAFSALTAYRWARANDARFLLRIEDIDLARCKPAFEEAIYQDLAWLGLTWEEPVRRQSEHFDFYRDALDQLIEKGLVYRCFKTRREIAEDIERAPHLAPDGPEGPAYMGAPLDPVSEQNLLEAGAAFAWRLSMEKSQDFLGPAFNQLDVCLMEAETDRIVSVQANPAQFGDVILARKDFGTSYHLSSVVDDALQGITHVIRGDDLRAAADLHRLLQVLLDLPETLYLHHRLLTDENGERLSKRQKSLTLRALREEGKSPEDIAGMVRLG